MGIAFRQSGKFGWIKTRIHTGKNGITACRRHGQLAFLTEGLCILEFAFRTSSRSLLISCLLEGSRLT
jgi:hypothetical protein